MIRSRMHLNNKIYLSILFILSVTAKCSNNHGIKGITDGGDSSEVIPDMISDDETTPSSTCGNGILDEGEECDDGNRMNGDGCDWQCNIGDGDIPSTDPDPSVEPPVTDGPPVAIVVGDEVGFTGNALDLEWNGSQFSVLYHYIDEHSVTYVKFKRFDSTGSELPNEWELIAGEWDGGVTVDHVWNGEEYGVFYGTKSLGGIWFIRISESGKRKTDPIQIVYNNCARYHAVAWSGDSYGLSWLHWPERVPRVCEDANIPLIYSTFDTNGEQIIDEPIEVDRRCTWVPRIAWDHDRAFVLATGVLIESDLSSDCYRGISIFSILPNGTIVDSVAIGNGDHSDIAARNDEYMVTFSYYDPYRPVSSYGGIYISRFLQPTTLLEPPYKIYDYEMDSRGLRIVNDTHGYAVIWIPEMGEYWGSIRLARLDRYGRMVGDPIIVADGRDPLITDFDIMWGAEKFCVVYSSGDTIFFQFVR